MVPTNSPSHRQVKCLAISHLKTLQQRLPNTHFVMHGSSSVPQEWLQAIINNYGGDIAQTYGVPVDEIVEGIQIWCPQSEYRYRSYEWLQYGIDQTVSRYRQKMRLTLDPREFLKASTAAMQAICQASV